MNVPRVAYQKWDEHSSDVFHARIGSQNGAKSRNESVELDSNLGKGDRSICRIWTLPQLIAEANNQVQSIRNEEQQIFPTYFDLKYENMWIFNKICCNRFQDCCIEILLSRGYSSKRVVPPFLWFVFLACGILEDKKWDLHEECG